MKIRPMYLSVQRAAWTSFLVCAIVFVFYCVMEIMTYACINAEAGEIEKRMTIWIQDSSELWLVLFLGGTIILGIANYGREKSHGKRS